MGIFIYIFKTLYRFKWWLTLLPLLIVSIVIYMTQDMDREYEVDMTIYTGIISTNGNDISQTTQQDWNILKNSLLNVINTIHSKETLHVVSLRLFARTMINGNLNEDNIYISSEHFRELMRIVPQSVLALIDKTSEEQTVENLRNYIQMDRNNFVYGLLNWNHPYFSYNALENIKITPLDNSDILYLTYENNDAGITYQTLEILSQVFADEYRTLQYGNTNNVIKYFEQELARTGRDLYLKEDSLTQFNVQNRVIHYDKQTEAITILDRDYETRKQDALSARDRAQAAVNQLELGIDENLKSIKNNTEFLNKMRHISDLNYSISQIESYRPDSTYVAESDPTLNRLKSNLQNQEKDFRDFIEQYSSQKYTRNGYPNANYVIQWVDELLKLEQAKAELEVINTFKDELDEMYLHYSPIGSLLKRQERSINFTEQNYLSILRSLNEARLRLKSIEMNSATLKVINPPDFPLNAKPTKRKMLVAGSYLGTIAFLLGLLLVLELLDRTLRDKFRTERITNGSVVGAFPGKGKGRYQHVIEQAAAQALANQIFGYIDTGNRYSFINMLALDPEIDITPLMYGVREYWQSLGLKVDILEEGIDFNARSRDFLMMGKLIHQVRESEHDLVFVRHADISNTPIPSLYLEKAAVNILVLNAQSAWKEEDQEIYKDLAQRTGKIPLLICLIHADRLSIETFTGMLPPHSLFRKIEYKFSQLGITASKA